MSYVPNPNFPDFLDRLQQAGKSILTPWAGFVWRFNAIDHPSPKEILSGMGAYRFGSRWNAAGAFPVVYGSTSEQVAVAEAQASDQYYGLVCRKPRLFVCIRFKLAAMLDLSSAETLKKLGISQDDLQLEDWRKTHDEGYESLTQSIGRAAAEFGAEAILCRSVRVKEGLNLAWFPRNKPASSEAEICEAEKLTRVSYRKI